MEKRHERYYGILGKRSKFLSMFFMLAGIIGAVALRLVLPLSRISNFYASISWYFAMIILIIFYTYRIYIEDKRQALIIKNRLVEKTKEGKLSEDDFNQISILLNSILVSKLKFNFVFFLILSLAFLIFQLIIDIIL